MGLPKGKTNNPEGRPAGTPNKLTIELREALKTALSGEIERIPEYLNSLDEKDKLEALSKFMPYILPKFSTIEITGNFETNHKTEVDLSQLSTDELVRRFEVAKRIEETNKE